MNGNQAKARLPPKVTHGRKYGGSGSDCLFIFGYFGNENILLLDGVIGYEHTLGFSCCQGSVFHLKDSLLVSSACNSFTSSFVTSGM